MIIKEKETITNKKKNKKRKKPLNCCIASLWLLTGNSATTDWITLHWLRSKEHHPVKHVSWCFDHDLTEHWTALVLWWTIKQGQFLLCDIKQKHYVIVHVSELSLGLQVLTWFIVLSSRTTAVLLRSNQNLAVEFLLLLFESVFHFFSFQPTVPEKTPHKQFQLNCILPKERPVTYWENQRWYA